MAKPQIRLKGFEGEWENVCFKDFSYPAGEKNRDNLPLESYSISNEFGFVPQNEQFEKGGTMANADKRMYYIVKPDSFAYNPARINVGSIGYDNLDKDVIVSSLYVIFKTDSETNNEWLNIWFKTPYFKRLVELYQEGGVRLYFFYDKLCACHLNRPLLLEQKAIADYFKSLDSMLQSTTKKIESLKQMKSACLVSMFPQAGETTPRVRFKGFEGEWECEPLCNFSKKVIKKNQNLEYKITLTNSAEYGIINQLDFFDHDVSNGDNIRGYYVVDNDDFVYNPRISATAPVGPINRNLLGYAGVMSPLYYVFRVHGIDKDYMSVFFKTTLWHKFMKDNGNSGARFDRLSITDDVFVQMPILYPKDIKEQQRIASYFRSLDKQISLQEKRLEKLNRIKAACLDKMFV